MTTEKMTIHKALCELKTLEARITKGINESVYVFANKHSNAKVAGMTVSAYCEEIKSAHQRVLFAELSGRLFWLLFLASYSAIMISDLAAACSLSFPHLHGDCASLSIPV